jgi:hypothetical protein
MLSDVSVIIVNWNGMHYLDACLRSIDHVPSVVLVDNGSTDGSVAFVREHFPRVRLVENGRNLGFSAANNAGVRACTGEYLLFLNNDTIVRAGAVERLRAAFDRDPAIAVAGGRLEQPDGRVQAGSFGSPPSFEGEWHRIFLRGRSRAPAGNSPDHDLSQYTSMVCGACLMMRRDVLEALGGWPEEYFAYAEDADLCRRTIAMGHRVWYESEARVLHFHGGSGKQRGAWSALRARYISHRSINCYIRRYEGTGRSVAHAALFVVDVLLSGLGLLGRALGRATSTSPQ